MAEYKSSQQRKTQNPPHGFAVLQPFRSALRQLLAQYVRTEFIVISTSPSPAAELFRVVL
jgi:hypothetical protein